MFCVFSHRAKSNEFGWHISGSAHHIVPLGFNFLSLAVIPVKIQLPLAEPCAAAPGESGLCPCQDFQCNSRCLSSALESLSITWNHRLKVCPHTDPSQATGFFNKGMKAGFCRLPGELRAPGSGRSRQSRFQQGTAARVLPAALLGPGVLQLEQLHSLLLGICEFQGTASWPEPSPRF